jgi:hypothetical protein
MYIFKKIWRVALYILAPTLLIILVDLTVGEYIYVKILKLDLHVGQSYGRGWYELRKNFEGFYSWNGQKFKIFTDQYGYRVSNRLDSLRDLQRDKGDIIFLGDSFTFSGYLPYEESYVGIVQNSIDKTIINSGVYSYSPTAYIYKYQVALLNGLLSKPHLVVLALDISDVQDEAALRKDGPDHPISMKSSTINSSIDLLHENLDVFYENHLPLLKFTFKSLFQSVQPKAFPGPQYIGDAFDLPRSAFTWVPWSKLDNDRVLINKTEGIGYAPLGVSGGIKKISEKLTQLKLLADANGGRLMILIYPWPAQIKYKENIYDWSKFAINLCNDIKCEGVIDATPEFYKLAQQNSDWYKKYFFYGDIHYNKNGNIVLANEILKNRSFKKAINLY